jgi:hypothetical protein
MAGCLNSKSLGTPPVTEEKKAKYRRCSSKYTEVGTGLDTEQTSLKVGHCSASENEVTSLHVTWGREEKVTWAGKVEIFTVSASRHTLNLIRKLF